MASRAARTATRAKLRSAVVLISLLAMGDQLSAQEVRASVSTETVYLGDSVIYQVRVRDLDLPSAKAPFVKNARVEPIGAPTVQAILDRRGRHYRVMTFSWRLTPRKGGELLVPATTVRSAGRDYKSQPVRLKVLVPSDTALAVLSAKVDRDRIYPRQRFTVEFTVEMPLLPEPWSGTTPVSADVLQNPPALQVPWFEDSRLPDGVEALQPLDTRPWRTSDRSGFTINGLRRFGFLTFLPKPELIEAGNANEPERVRYTFKRRFLAKKAGQFELGNATLRGALARDIKDNRVSFEQVFTATEPVVVNVEALPLDSRPESWVGVIGDLDVRCEITPKAGRVGQPMTLTLTLEGSGAVADAFPPDLSRNEEVTRRFRLYEPTSRRTHSTRVFEYALRPRQTGDITFPPIAISWFDPLREEYVTGRTSEIPLQISAGTTLTGDDIQTTDTGLESELTPMIATAPATSVGTNLTQLTDDSLRPRRWFIAWAVMTGISSVIYWLVGRNASSRVRLARLRREMLSSAESDLKEAVAQLRSGDRTSGLTRVRAIVNRIASVTTNSFDEGLTTDEVCTRLQSASYETTLVGATRELLERCDAARYGTADSGLTEIGDLTQETVGKLLQAARQERGDA